MNAEELDKLMSEIRQLVDSRKGVMMVVAVVAPDENGRDQMSTAVHACCRVHAMAMTVAIMGHVEDAMEARPSDGIKH